MVPQQGRRGWPGGATITTESGPASAHRLIGFTPPPAATLFAFVVRAGEPSQTLFFLDDDVFRQALVYLRRASGEFESGESRRVVSNRAEISSEGADELKASVDTKLDEEVAGTIK